jgi:nicotinate-nucleotide pyrophosphorylase (carboxylating)
MELDIQSLRTLARAFLEEDVGRGDLTTRVTVPAAAKGSARIVAGTEGVLAGLEVAKACFDSVQAGAVRWAPALEEGARIEPGRQVVELSGSLRTILTAERTALNLLSRLSGVATATASLANLVDDLPVRVVDTRKTTPGLRALEKYAVTVGGGMNHRFGLDDGILIKDNHIAAAGGVTEAVTRAKDHAPHGLRIQVEVTTFAELDDAVAAGADAVLLDNMTVQQVKEAVLRVGGKVILEASGGIDRSNIRDYAKTGIDVISVGAMTHSAPHIDFSLEVDL